MKLDSQDIAITRMAFQDVVAQGDKLEMDTGYRKKLLFTDSSKIDSLGQIFVNGQCVSEFFELVIAISNFYGRKIISVRFNDEVSEEWDEGEDALIEKLKKEAECNSITGGIVYIEKEINRKIYTHTGRELNTLIQRKSSIEAAISTQKAKKIDCDLKYDEKKQELLAEIIKTMVGDVLYLSEKQKLEIDSLIVLSDLENILSILQNNQLLGSAEELMLFNVVRDIFDHKEQSLMRQRLAKGIILTEAQQQKFQQEMQSLKVLYNNAKTDIMLTIQFLMGQHKTYEEFYKEKLAKYLRLADKHERLCYMLNGDQRQQSSAHAIEGAEAAAAEEEEEKEEVMEEVQENCLRRTDNQVVVDSQDTSQDASVGDTSPDASAVGVPGNLQNAAFAVQGVEACHQR